jgi:putative hydrolase of the HAD superfamily
MHHIKLGVLSNFSLASLEQSLVTTGLMKYFDVTCAAVVIGAAKPSQRAYEIALEALQVRPENCLFFDDEAECVEGAAKVGLHAYLVDRRSLKHRLENRLVSSLEPVPLLALGRA